jgi:hypothetical protein
LDAEGVLEDDSFLASGHWSVRSLAVARRRNCRHRAEFGIRTVLRLHRQHLHVLHIFSYTDCGSVRHGWINTSWQGWQLGVRIGSCSPS